MYNTIIPREPGALQEDSSTTVLYQKRGATWICKRPGWMTGKIGMLSDGALAAFFLASFGFTAKIK